MRKVIQTYGTLISGGATTAPGMVLPRQGMAFYLRRVFLTFGKVIPETSKWYLSLVHRNGEGEVIGLTSTTASENTSDGSVHFFGEVEFRSHLNGNSQEFMTAPIGCEGFRVDTNDTVEIVFSAESGLVEDLQINKIYWHCDFETQKKD